MWGAVLANHVLKNGIMLSPLFGNGAGPVKLKRRTIWTKQRLATEPENNGQRAQHPHELARQAARQLPGHEPRAFGCARHGAEFGLFLCTLNQHFASLMLLSMTGYGLAHRETDTYSATVELKSLNSKTLDLTLRLPRFLQAHELEIRTTIAKALLRGKVNLNLDFVRPAATRTPATLNTEALIANFHELQAVAQRLGLPTSETTLLAALRLPGVIPSASEARDAEPVAEDITWTELQPLLTQALAAMQQFRQDEGHTLSIEILGYVATIRQQLAAVEEHDPARIAHVRQRLATHLAELTSHEQFNTIRFEQEVLYYIEKLDIAEEKVRLAAHLAYFEQAVHQPDEAVGKKLGFLAQEIGREINTIGSKANDATVQHLVVGMKEELEKIKEQLNNIL